MRVIRPAGDTEPKSCAASFQQDLFVFPFRIAVHLQQKQILRRVFRLFKKEKYLYLRDSKVGKIKTPGFANLPQQHWQSIVGQTICQLHALRASFVPLPLTRLSMRPNGSPSSAQVTIWYPGRNDTSHICATRSYQIPGHLPWSRREEVGNTSCFYRELGQCCIDCILPLTWAVMALITVLHNRKLHNFNIVEVIESQEPRWVRQTVRVVKTRNAYILFEKSECDSQF